MYDLSKIAERVRIKAKEKKIKIGDLLSDCGLGVNTISEMAKGREVSIINFAKIADALDCSVDYLLGRTDNPQINR